MLNCFTNVGVTTHALLDGLSADDHSQYIYSSPASSARNVITAGSAGTTPLTLKAAASQTADILSILNSAGSTLARFTKDGCLVLNEAGTATNSTVLKLYRNAGTGFVGLVNVYNNAGTYIGGFGMNSAGLVIYAATVGVSASLQFYGGSSGAATGAPNLWVAEAVLGQNKGVAVCNGNGFGTGDTWYSLYASSLICKSTYTGTTTFVTNPNGSTAINNTADAVTLTLKGHTTQTNNILEVQDSSANVLAKVDNSGNTTIAGDLAVNTVGKGIGIKGGTNARIGVATLAAGNVTVNTTAINANRYVQLTPQTVAGVARPTALGITARVNGTSFTITSASTLDTSTVLWEIKEIL